MFNIKTEIGNFSTFKDLFLEMSFTGTKKVHCNCSYVFDPVGEFDLNLEELERLAAKNQLDDDTNKIIKKFSQK